MEKVRVYELARDLGIPSPQAIQLLKERLQIRVKSASSTIEEDVAIKLKRLIRLENAQARGLAGEREEVRSAAAGRADRARRAILEEAEREEAERRAAVEREEAERQAMEQAALEEAARLAAAARKVAEAQAILEAEVKAQAEAERVEELAPPSGPTEPAPAPAGFEPPAAPPPVIPPAPAATAPVEVAASVRPAATATTGERPRPAPARPGFVPGPTSTIIRPARPAPLARPAPMKPIPPPPRPAAPIKTVSRRRAEPKPKGREARAVAVELKEPPLPAPPKVLEQPKPELPQVFRKITLTEGVTVKELSEKMEAKHKDVIRAFMNRGILATINQTLETALAVGVAREFGCEAEILSFEEDVVREEVGVENPEDLLPRAPVVTVMGHVDHGKTSLLDAIRQTKVVEREAGGITQHIGAYKVAVNGRSIVFLDTPGHEAFTMMRARGARVTDLVVLVVAADDGVMPQTVEAIDHARAAGVPILVAINKIDKPEANAERVKKQLADLGLMPEAWGGSTVFCEVSAKQRRGLDLLLEMVLLVSDIQELQANPKRAGTGTVLEAKIDKGKGPVAHVLIQNGTVEVGNSFIAGAVYGKVRAMIDELGHKLRKAGPATPVEILGLIALPQAGDQFQVIADSFKARQIGEFRQQKLKDIQLAKSARLTLDQLHQQVKEGVVKELPIVLKADVQGSVEVLSETLGKLSTEKVKLKIIHAGAGAITDTDVLLASASNAIVIGFNVRPEKSAAELAEKENVDLRLHTVIYNVTDEIKKAMTGLLEPTFREVRLGQAEVRNTFRVPRVGTVAGCYVTEGKAVRGAEARLVRDNVVVYEGKIGSLKRFKEDVPEVRSGFECGIGLANFNDIKIGDVIEVLSSERVQEEAVQ